MTLYYVLNNWESSLACLWSPKWCNIQWQNFACRQMAYQCNIWVGSDGNRCHHWENVLF